MERIDPFDRTVYKDYKKEKKRIEKKSGLSRLFPDLLRSVEETDGENEFFALDEEPEKQLEALLDEVHETGERLKNDPTVGTIKAYKEAVRGFLALVIRKSYAIEETISGINIMKRKRLTIVKLVDQKLDRLASGILLNQRDQMEILRKIEEINGLLVDLMR
jgi:uncharacterized protein YaaR (DUF327 family)